jgi:hypothetical protein
MLAVNVLMVLEKTSVNGHLLVAPAGIALLVLGGVEFLVPRWLGS